MTDADLDRAFAEQAFGEFLLLGKSSEDCIQADETGRGSGAYRIQWWSPTREKMHATREALTLDQVHQAFVGYLHGRDWWRGFDWVPWEPDKIRIPCEGDCGRFPLAGDLDDGTLFLAFVTGERAAGGGSRSSTGLTPMVATSAARHGSGGTIRTTLTWSASGRMPS